MLELPKHLAIQCRCAPEQMRRQDLSRREESRWTSVSTMCGHNLHLAKNDQRLSCDPETARDYTFNSASHLTAASRATRLSPALRQSDHAASELYSSTSMHEASSSSCSSSSSSSSSSSYFPATPWQHDVNWCQLKPSILLVDNLLCQWSMHPYLMLFGIFTYFHWLPTNSQPNSQHSEIACGHPSRLCPAICNAHLGSNVYCKQSWIHHDIRIGKAC